MTRNHSRILASIGALLVSAPAYAVECVTTSTGGAIPAAELVVIDEDATATATFCDGSAGYTSDVYLGDPSTVYIGTGHVTPSGTEVDLGAFTAGDELIFFIYVHDTGYTYYTGPGSRNPDGVVHAAVTELGEGLYHVGFEDLWGGGDADYDDINIVVQTEGIVIADDDLDDDGIPDDEDNCVADPNPDQTDADADGKGDLCDVCPYDAEDDADGDGLCGDADACPDTVLPEGVPTMALGINRWADVNGDGVFETVMPKGKGPGRAYTIEDTAGCSCEQIIDALDLGVGHVKYGCSISAMDEWTARMGY